MAGAQRIVSHTLVINFLKGKDPEEGCTSSDAFVAFSGFHLHVSTSPLSLALQSGSRTDSEHDRNSFWNGAEVQE